MRWLPILLLLSGCSAVPKLWDAPVIKKEIDYVHEEISCGPKPNVDALHLLRYEPTVLPDLLTLGVDINRVPDWLTEHLDHKWVALSIEHWEAVDKNDIDKKRLAEQQQKVIHYYEKCIEQYNDKHRNDKS